MIRAALLYVLLAACSPVALPGGSYKLYRTSLVPSDPLVYIATFDSPNGAAFNQENCEIARGLFQSQPGVLTRFVCEKA